MVTRAEDYRWSSVRRHAGKEKIDFIEDSILKDIIGDWKMFLQKEVIESEIALLRKHESTGRPLGAKTFIEQLEKKLKRNIRKKKTGPKPKKSRKALIIK